MGAGLVGDAIVEIIGSKCVWIDGIARRRIEVNAKDGSAFSRESETNRGT